MTRPLFLTNIRQTATAVLAGHDIDLDDESGAGNVVCVSQRQFDFAIRARIRPEFDLDRARFARAEDDENAVVDNQVPARRRDDIETMIDLRISDIHDVDGHLERITFVSDRLAA